ncbi:hypothetical protein [Terrabacter carboxydivorans]|uniref:Uncharacterized protein n=1 Tax=Terrabacter carboxydivorans TaxID=619730 RepID=A0ABP5YJP5_9MICO
MSDIPPYEPDPTRDATADSWSDDATVAGAPAAETSASPSDLPSAASGREGVTAYDTTFGVQQPATSSWVPARAGDDPPPAAPALPASADAPRTVTLSSITGRALGGRLQPWHVAAVVVGLLVPLGLWAVTSSADESAPVAQPRVGITRLRPSVTLTVPVPTVTPLVPGGRPSAPAATKTVTAAPRPTRSAAAAPPKVVTVPAVPVTPVPAAARTIRFETYAENNARIEVSLSDAAHRRTDFPPQAAPLAFEAPVDPAATSNDYYSLRVRISDPTGSAVRGAVTCRILVDGIVVTAQQGQGYATCSLSPYFDIQRH